MSGEKVDCFLVDVVEINDIAPRREPTLPNLFVKVFKSSDGDPSIFIRSRRTVLGKSFVRLRPDLHGYEEFENPKTAKLARDKLASTLAKSGYTVNPVKTAKRSIYVLELKSRTPEKRRFYVGQTTKPVEVRIDEHLQGVRHSRAVRSDFLCRAEEFEPKRTFFSKWDAESEATSDNALGGA